MGCKISRDSKGFQMAQWRFRGSTVFHGIPRDFRMFLEGFKNVPGDSKGF